jgi:protein TonB
MEDRVGDVLGERAALGNGAAAGIAVSLFLHAALTAAGIFAALHSTAPQATNVINIQFAKIPRAAAPVTPVAPAAVAPTPPKPLPRITEPQPQPPQPTTANPQPRTVPLSPFGQSTKKGSESPPVPQPSSAPAPQPQATNVTVEGDFPYTLYIERMKTLIGTHWFRPQGAGAITTTVYFAIDRDGALRDARVETSSGNGAFDRGALRAVLESSPLPPLPFGYNGTYLGVHLTFR